jgi:lysozyme
MTPPTTASVRAAAEEIAKRGQVLPHQLAAFSALDERLTPGQRQAFTADWRAAGSPTTRLTAPGSWLRLTVTKRATVDRLRVLRLGYWRGGVEIDGLDVVSGAPGRQFFRLATFSKAGSFEPLPEGLWRIADAAWATGQPDDYSGSWGAGLGPVSIPLAFVGPGRTERSAIEIHIDSNARAGSPGTAGCIGISGVDDYRKLMTWLRATDPRDLYVDWNLGSCPRPTG